MDTMAKVFRVDVPPVTGAGEEWGFVNEFDTRDEAIEFCMREFGSDNQGRIDLITEDDDEADLESPQISLSLADIDDNETTEVVHVTRLIPDPEEDAIQAMYQYNRDKMWDDQDDY